MTSFDPEQRELLKLEMRGCFVGRIDACNALETPDLLAQVLVG